MPRVCDVCQSFDAILFCRADSAFLCIACDFKVHQANKLAFRHERLRICDGCELASADFTCKAKIDALCVACNIKVRSANTHVGQHEQSPIVPIIVAQYVTRNDIADSLHVQKMDFEHHTRNASHNDIVDSLHVQDMGLDQCAHNAAHINLLDPLHVPEMGIIQLEHDNNVVDDELCASWLVQHDFKLSDSSKDDGESASTESKKVLMGWEEENFHVIESFMLSEPCEENVCIHVGDSLVPSLAHTSSVASNAFQTYEAGHTQGIVSPSIFLTSTMGMGVVPNVALNCKSATKTAPCLCYMGHLSNSRGREARVLRYKEKRKNRNFEKIVRYASRKAYAEARPRVNGRFAKHPYEVSKHIKSACDNDPYVFSVVSNAGFDDYQKHQASQR